MIELSDRELCTLIRAVDGARRIVNTRVLTKTVWKTLNAKDEVLQHLGREIIEDEELKDGELEPIDHGAAVQIAAQVGGPFQAEITRCIMEVLR